MSPAAAVAAGSPEGEAGAKDPGEGGAEDPGEDCGDGQDDNGEEDIAAKANEFSICIKSGILDSLVNREKRLNVGRKVVFIKERIMLNGSAKDRATTEVR